MAVKTFITGEVLTASDTNTYLANSGLVYVTSKTLSGSSAQIDSCFTSTYDAYRIIFTNLVFSAADSMTLRLVTGTTPDTSANYYSGRIGVGFAGTVNGAANAAVSYWNPNIVGVTVAGGGNLEIFNPKNTAVTSFNSIGGDSRTTGDFYRAGGGYFNATTAFDGLWISTLSGSNTMTGTAVVYGYRKV